MSNISSKIAKLLALSTNNPSHHEAEAALRLALRLMEKHAISEADVKGLSTQEISSSFIDTPPATWRVNLATALSNLHGCYSYYTPRRGITVAGSKTSRDAVIHDFHFLSTVINHLTLRNSVGLGRSYAESFRRGMVSKISDEISSALSAARAESQAAGASTTALTVTTSAISRAKEWVTQATTIRTVRASAVRSHDAYSSGRIAGTGLYTRASQQKLR